MPCQASSCTIVGELTHQQRKESGRANDWQNGHHIGHL